MIRSLLLAASLLFAPAAVAQATPEAAFTRFVELANAGKLATPEGQAILTGEAKAQATDAKSALSAAERIVKIGPDKAVAHIVLRGDRGQEADVYFFLERANRRWAVSAYRTMPLSGMDVMLLAQMRRQRALNAEDALIKRNLEITHSSDSQLRTWFATSKPSLEALVKEFQALPAPRAPANTTDRAGLGAKLPEMGLTRVETLGDGVHIVIGQGSGGTVGMLKAGPAGPPKMDLMNYFWVEDFGGGWYLVRFMR